MHLRERETTMLAMLPPQVFALLHMLQQCTILIVLQLYIIDTQESERQQRELELLSLSLLNTSTMYELHQG
jgi:hypothetical protein